ncbi:hypothetical protein EDC04DRAFT_3143206 [Pisolithus marmoratus]|nr:hypothetical protein EDC04DRAFT_3143206 [Pisolithus marmoratus]
MERYCGVLQQSIQSRPQPWSNLNNTLLRSIALEQLCTCYDLSAELASWDDREGDGPVGFEHTFEGYPDHIICLPFKKITQQDPSLQQKIAQYVAQVLGKRESEVKKRLPTPLFYAGKLWVCGGGDSFWMTAITSRAATPQRKN